MAQQARADETANDKFVLILEDEGRYEHDIVPWAEARERLIAFLGADENGWTDGKAAFVEDVLTAIFTGRDHGA